MRRGDVVTAPAGAVLLLDYSPRGWWVYVVDQVDARGNPLVIEVRESDLVATPDLDLFS